MIDRTDTTELSTMAKTVSSILIEIVNKAMGYE
jgi:hypothetical protein